jgi:Uma2 family endonuclease
MKGMEVLVATAALIPLSEYLSTTYRPDRDFLEGELKERNMGEQPHARVQLIIAKKFDNNRKHWDTRTSTELRVQVRHDRFRIPDICVLRRSDPFEPIVTKAPLLCIEVLSSGDSLRELQERVNDYAAMGTEHIWAVDPWGRAGYYASTRGFQQPEDGVLRIVGTPIGISLAEVFAELDEP